MTGRFNSDTLSPPFDRVLNYEIVGMDVSAHYGDQFRIHAEYAMRNSDLMISPTRVVDEELSGFNVEGELLLFDEPRLSLIVRYDTISRNGDLLPPGSSFSDPEFTVHRLTWGFTLTLPGESVLLVNLEHWRLPQGSGNVDVVGFRWVATL